MLMVYKLSKVDEQPNRVHATDSFIEIPVLSTGTCSEFRTFFSLKKWCCTQRPRNACSC